MLLKFLRRISERVKNSAIKAKSISLINEEGKLIDSVDLREALKSKPLGTDIILIHSRSEIPLCKIVKSCDEYKKKKSREEAESFSRRQAKEKEIQLFSNVAENDFEVKMRHLEQFLEKKIRTEVKLLENKRAESSSLDRLCTKIREVANKKNSSISEEIIRGGVLFKVVPK